MNIYKCEFFNSLISRSKFLLTTIVKTDFTDFRFYDNVFLQTPFDVNDIAKALFENLSVVEASINKMMFLSTSMISIDFRDSTFQ